MKEKSVFGEIYEITQDAKTEIGKMVHERFERDDFDIIVYKKRWYLCIHGMGISAEVYKWIERYMKKNYNAMWIYD